jgi:hypothetical protein
MFAQAWICETIKENPSEMPGLLEGKASAFARIYSAAMLKLVVNTKPTAPTLFPETLLFDVSRLTSLQLEFGYIVTATTMMVKSAHTLSACKGINLHQHLVCISEILTAEAQMHVEIEQVFSILFCVVIPGK